MKSPSGITIVEVIVIIAIVCVLIALALPSIGDGLQRGEITRVLSNMKQLQLVAQQMALDGETTGDTNLGWPGDLGGTFSNWAKQLVPAYLATNDFDKLLSVSRHTVRPGTLPLANTNPVLVYAVSRDSPPETVLFSTANFTNTPAGGTPPTQSLVREEGRGFVIFRKGNSGAVLLAKQGGNSDVVGAFAPLCR